MIHTYPAPAALSREDRHQRGPTFKNSLRLWQARWKAQKSQSDDLSRNKETGTGRLEQSMLSAGPQ
jgi:hypothetical protein